MIIMSFGCFGASAKRKGKKGRSHSHIPNEIDGYPLANVRQFSDRELRMATDNYHSNSKIGRGGFGTVYQCKSRYEATRHPYSAMKISVHCFSDNKNTSLFEVLSLDIQHQDHWGMANIFILRNLKRWKTGSSEDPFAGSRQGVREFLAEIKTLSNVKHPNLVELVGFCIQGPSRTLVYEYVDNGNLDSAILGKRSSSIKLNWRKRSGICIGTAKGLAFLHEELVPHTVHRDIKASNVLLDKDCNPKIGDFGLAKLFPDDITHISTKIAGTTGYLAPEYALAGQLTKKADVYSFGVLILEIISGKRSSKTNWGGSNKLLLAWAWQLHEEGKLLDLVDPDMGKFPEKEVIKYMKVAFFCTQAVASSRPSMTQVVDMLSKEILLNENQLTAPGFFMDAAGESSLKKSTSDSKNPHVSSTNVSITQVIPR